MLGLVEETINEVNYLKFRFEYFSMVFDDLVQELLNRKFVDIDNLRIRFFTDKRGPLIFVQYTTGDNETELATIETYGRGVPRAGHYHPYIKTKDVLLGQIAWRLANPETGEETDWKISNTRDEIMVPANYASLFVGLDPFTVLLAPKYGQEYEAKNYPPYRQIVEQYLKGELHIPELGI